MAFATLPHIKTCGHEVMFDNLHEKLIEELSGEDDIYAIIENIQSHYNCLGLSCDDVGSHNREGDAWDSFAASTKLPECSDVTMITGYSPENATKTNMVSEFVSTERMSKSLSSTYTVSLSRRLPDWTSTLWQSTS